MKYEGMRYEPTITFGVIPDADQTHKRWHWKIRAFRGSQLQLETVHTSVHSRDIELEAIKNGHMTAEVYKRGPRGAWNKVPQPKRRAR